MMHKIHNGMTQSLIAKDIPLCLFSYQIPIIAADNKTNVTTATTVKKISIVFIGVLYGRRYNKSTLFSGFFSNVFYKFV